jgi:hypothetical protein
MVTIWRTRIVPVIITLLFSLFIIIIALLLIKFAWFMRRELVTLIKKYDRDNIVKFFLEGHLKGLLDLIISNRKTKRAQ